MALPRAIQAQVEQANAMLEAANSPADTPAETPANEASAEQPQESQPQTPAPEPITAPAPATVSPHLDPEQTWETRFKSLQGIFNAEVPRLQAQAKDLKAQLETALERLDKAADKAEQQQKEPEKPAADPRDVENFGSDLVDMVQRTAERMFGRAANEIQAQAARFEQRLAQLEKALQGTTQTVAMTAEQSFFDRLTKLVPEWEQINANQAFLAWLGEVDPIYGQPRQAALDVAQQTLNAERAAAVFKAFAGTTPPATKAASLDKQVSPKGTAATAAPAPKQAVVYTQQQVVDFYNAKRRGEFRGREQDAARYEAEINLAISEGRVR